MGGLSEYEKQRQINLKENREMLESLGLLKPFGNLAPQKKSTINGNLKKRKRQKAKKLQTEKPLLFSDHTYTEFSRRSLRVKGIEPDVTVLPDKVCLDEEKIVQKSYYSVKRENTFGHISGIPVGTTWATRLECSRDGIHRPTVAGIHGSETDGCYSLALSGGYEDDIDLGDSFTYTGEGGRDLKGTKANPKNLRTAPQSKDQSLTKGNKALTRNVENKRPVRVIRGYKLLGAFAPEEGYRFDGLYTVEKCWQAVGLSGFSVYKFILKRCPNQDPSPWNVVTDIDSNGHAYEENDNDSPQST